jgi:hypothetical protein
VTDEAFYRVPKEPLAHYKIKRAKKGEKKTCQKQQKEKSN